MNNNATVQTTQKDPEYVYFISPHRRQPGTAEDHAASIDRIVGLFSRKIEDVEKDWQVVVDQSVRLVSQNVNKAPEGYKMDQIEVALGFNAQGQLAFIAEAGAQASVTITFKRLP